VLAFAAPSLARFIGQRTLEEEATRFLAVTQFGQSEATSLGIPLVLWIDPMWQQYGLEPMAGFAPRGGKPLEYELHKDVEFVVEGRRNQTGGLLRIEFWPDGTLGQSSVAEVILEDRRGERLYLVWDVYGLGYEVLGEEMYALRLESMAGRW
jgi:hypothetical protein